MARRAPPRGVDDAAGCRTFAEKTASICLFPCSDEGVAAHTGQRRKTKEKDLLEGPEIKFAEAVLDNGRFGTRTVRFEAGRLAQQAQGAVAAYLDEETMLLSATSASKHPK